MISIKIGCTKKMPCRISRMGSLAFNGCDYAMISQCYCGITKLNENLCPVVKVQTCRKYSNLCFDMYEDCYWASAQCEPDCLFKLDFEFKEIGKLKLNGCCCRQLKGISCSPCGNMLLLAYENSVAYVEKNTGLCHQKPCKGQGSQNFGILALCDGCMLAYFKCGRQYIDVQCPPCGGEANFCVPADFSLKAMILKAISTDKCSGCITYEVELVLSRRCNCELFLMSLYIECCQQIEPPHPPCPPCSCGKYEIMHSIALEEASIAHILNAEGEKIQKAVASDASICELLKINDSVRRTISQITQIEGVLLSKLESLIDICDEDLCHEDPCHQESCHQDPCCEDPCHDESCSCWEEEPCSCWEEDSSC